MTAKAAAATKTSLEFECREHVGEEESVPIVLDDEYSSGGGGVINNNNERQLQHQQGSTDAMRRMKYHVLFLTLILEGFTCLLRFGFGMQSTRDSAGTMGRLTGGIRIHHGYLGVLILLICYYGCCSSNSSRPTNSRRYCLYWMKVVGWSLVASDFMHHFLVLWPVTGSPQFDLVYPKR